MRDNPISNDPTSVKSADSPKGLPDLPMKQATPPAAQMADTMADDSAEVRQEEALTFRYAIGKLNDFLQWFVAVLEVTLLIRFILKLIGADPGNLFAGFIYALTDIVLFPFSTIVRSPSIHVNQAFEWSTLIGMIVYYLVFWAIRRFLRILISGPEEPAS